MRDSIADKNQRDVDFQVVRDGKPWFLVEAKHAEEKLSPSLKYFQQQLKVPFAFQVVFEADYVKADVFATKQNPLWCLREHFYLSSSQV